MLQGIVSTVPEKIRERLVFIREKICTVSGVEIMPPVFKPHITWQVVDQYDIPAVKAALEEVSGKMKTLDVVTTGLGSSAALNLLFIFLLCAHRI